MRYSALPSQVLSEDASVLRMFDNLARAGHFDDGMEAG